MLVNRRLVMKQCDEGSLVKLTPEGASAGANATVSHDTWFTNGEANMTPGQNSPPTGRDVAHEISRSRPTATLRPPEAEGSAPAPPSTAAAPCAIASLPVAAAPSMAAAPFATVSPPSAPPSAPPVVPTLPAANPSRALRRGLPVTFLSSERETTSADASAVRDGVPPARPRLTDDDGTWELVLVLDNREVGAHLSRAKTVGVV